jgi:hypothetical protein
MMTKKGKRPNQQTGKLKALLLTGSVIATLAGVRLLPLQEQAVAEAPVSVYEPVTIIVPSVETSTIPLPPGKRGTQVELKPIPQVVQPQINPVARTQSSR